MNWSIHHVALTAQDVARGSDFFGRLVGLGQSPFAQSASGCTVGASFGDNGRGLHVLAQDLRLELSDGSVMRPALGGCVAITVEDLTVVRSNLAKMSISYVDGPPGGLSGRDHLLVFDPSGNLIEVNQASGDDPSSGGVHPWETDWGWGLHHVNLQAHDVRASVAFFTELCGLEEGRWQAPDAMGDFSIDPARLAILPLGEGNRGLHLIEPDPGFGQRNGFAHNPSIGGHPAFWVGDIKAVMARMDEAGVAYSDAGVYAMPGMHQIYVFDPHANMIEINQYV